MILGVYYFTACVLMLRANFVGSTGTSNIEFYNLWNLMTVIALSLYYSFVIKKTLTKRIIAVICVVQTFYFVIINVRPSPEILFDSNGQVLLSVGILVMVFFYMAQLLQNVNEDPLSLNFDFWFSSAQLIYYLATFLIFLTFRYLTKKVIDGDYLDQDRELLTKLWAVHNVILFLSSSIIAGSTLWIRYRSKSASS